MILYIMGQGLSQEPHCESAREKQDERNFENAKCSEHETESWEAANRHPSIHFILPISLGEAVRAQA
jgi:hypothetical protein